MKFTSKEDAILVQNKLIQKLEEKEKELNNIKKGILQINQIVSKFNHKECPFIVESYKYLKLEASVQYEQFKTFEEAEKYQERLMNNALHTKESIYIFIYEYQLTDDLQESYLFKSFNQYILNNPSPNYIFYNLLLLKESKYSLNNQTFIPLPFLKKKEENLLFENIDSIYALLTDMIMHLEEVMKDTKIKQLIINTNPMDRQENLSEILETFNRLATKFISFNLIQKENTRQFELNQMYGHTESLEDLLAIHIKIDI